MQGNIRDLQNLSESLGVGSPKDSEELVQFRSQWKAEIQRRRAEARLDSEDVNPGIPASAEVGPSQPSVSPSSQDLETGSVVHSYPYLIPTVVSRDNQPYTSVHRSHGISAVIRGSLKVALEVYRKAVQCEEESRLDEAIQLYRRAFRLDSNVDIAYRKEEQDIQFALLAPTVSDSASAATKESHEIPSSSTGPSVIAVDGLTQNFKTLALDEIDGVTVGNALATVVKNFPEHLTFESEDETEGVPLNRLPDELLVYMLRSLDHSTIERFASVSRRARVVTLDSSIWRDFVETIYKAPQIPDNKSMNDLIARYSFDYRNIYIHHPRLRLDGVYIAVCHYLREGSSENAWINISHHITFHRYLRFYPSGMVLSLLANEEIEPQQIISMLKPSLRMKGLYIGNWQLTATTVHITNLLEASGKYPFPPVPSQTNSIPEGPRTHPRYAFQMLIGLRSRPVGKWNKLDLQEYDSVDFDTGEVIPLPLKHARPFWFSKVRSWAN